MHVADHDSTETLRRAARCAADPHVRKRIRAVLEARGGKPARQISEGTEVSEGTVRRWILMYNKHGLQAMYRSAAGGRPARLSKHDRQAIRTYITQFTKSKNGYVSLAEIRQVLNDEFDLALGSKRAVGRLLRQLGFSHMTTIVSTRQRSQRTR